MNHNGSTRLQWVLGILAVGCILGAGYLQWGDQLMRRVPTFTLEPLPAAREARVVGVRLETAESGIVSVSAEALRQAGFDFEAFSAETLNLTFEEEQTPFWVRDGVLYFYAEADSGTLDAPVAYRLRSGQGFPMEERDAQPRDIPNGTGFMEQRWEMNETFLPLVEREDPWFGPLIYAASEPHTMTLGAVLPHVTSGNLTLELWSNNESPDVDPDHHVIVSLNGQEIADLRWDGIQLYTAEIPYPADVVRPDGNVLELLVPGDTGAPGEAIYVDAATLRYEGQLRLEGGQLAFKQDAANIRLTVNDEETLLFNITNGRRPIVLTNARVAETDVDTVVDFAGEGLGGRYVALHPSDALQPVMTPIFDAVPLRFVEAASGAVETGDNGPVVQPGADYLALVPDQDGFMTALQPLLDHRRGQGLEVETVSLSQVFDEFGHGRRSPEAIRDFLRYVSATWDPAPRFVLLVGDANYDRLGFGDSANADVLPTYPIFTEHAGYVASDTWFALHGNTLAPSLAIGRFPVQTEAQLAAIVSKTIVYEKAGVSDWDQNVLLIADDESQFDRLSSALATQMREAGFQPNTLHMTEMGDDIHDDIVAAINEGVSIINYLGHGSVKVWGDERVFHADDAWSLTNRERLPIFTTFTCLNGYFNHPQDDALAETLLWAESGGVAAAIAPSGRTRSNEQQPLADRFYELLLSGEVTTIGEALQQAKVDVAANEQLRDVIHTFNLLGDPALQFRAPTP